MRLVYGRVAEDMDDKYICLAEAAMVAPKESSIPGSFLVDIFPFREPTLSSTQIVSH